MPADNYIKVVGDDLHEIFLFDSKDPSSGQKAHETAAECVAQYNEKRPKGVDGQPTRPARLSSWMPFRHLETIGNSRSRSRGVENDCE